MTWWLITFFTSQNINLSKWWPKKPFDHISFNYILFVMLYKLILVKMTKNTEWTPRLSTFFSAGVTLTYSDLKNLMTIFPLTTLLIYICSFYRLWLLLGLWPKFPNDLVIFFYFIKKFKYSYSFTLNDF